MTAYSERDFDSGFLGQPVWVLEDIAQAASVVAAARSFGVGLLVRRGEASEAGMLLPLGFRQIEILVTLEAPLSSGSADLPPMIRIATHEDAEAVSDIARCAFHTDRWHRDPMIPDDRADAYKAAWAGNNVQGRAAAVLLATDDAGRVLGFNALLIRGDVLVVDLIAVSPGHQGRGIGRALMAGAFAHGAGRARVLQVGTQAENHASLRLYERLGMQRIGTATTWHWTP